MTLPTVQLQTHWVRPGFTLSMDLTLPGTGVTVLFGPSGSGKTTCLRVLAGLEQEAPGLVCVGGDTWQNSADNRFVPVHQRPLGYVFQEASLFEHLTVEGNLRFGYDRTPPAQRQHGWDHGLDLLGIRHLLARRPQQLSGGERQRVAIARALATSPRLLLMDEPLAALDQARRADILPWLEQLHERLDIPVVYVTHAIDEVVRLADHVVVLDNGRVLAAGPVVDMLARTDLPLAQGDGAGALIEAITCGLDTSSDLCELRFAGGTLLLPQTRAQPLPPRTPVRLRVQARDVSLALEPPAMSSVLNILRATVSDVTPDGLGQVVVGLHVGPPDNGCRLLARISRVSKDRLGISPGLAVYAQIKGVAMVR